MKKENIANKYNEPDNIMLLSDEELEKMYDLDSDEYLEKINEIQMSIYDLLYQKDELTEEIKKMEFIINNEILDHVKAYELFDEIKYNQIQILKIEQEIEKLKKEYDRLMQLQDENIKRGF